MELDDADLSELTDDRLKAPLDIPVAEYGGQDDPIAASGALCLGLFILGMDLTILNVMIPDLHEDLRPSLAQIQWTVDGYALVLGGTVLACGTSPTGSGGGVRFSSGSCSVRGSRWRAPSHRRPCRWSRLAAAWGWPAR